MFVFTLYQSLAGIRDSMQLESGTRIAKLETDTHVVCVFVAGDVRVLWNPDPNKSYQDDGTELYKSPSQFPDDLMAVFAEGKTGLKNLYVDNNNWFEASIREKATGDYIYEDVWDFDNDSPSDILLSMTEVLDDIIEEVDSQNKSLARGNATEAKD